MEKIMKYSVLRYSPSKFAGERINIGIIFDSETEPFREFRFIKKFKRLSYFDDEIKIDVVKDLLKSIQEDVEGTLFRKEFQFEEYIKFFINDFYFEEPRRISYDEITEVVETLYKTYFRFDLEKKERPTINDDRKVISRILSDKGNKPQKNNWLYGKYHERVTYDIVTDDYCIKIFDFEHKDLSRVINCAKTWAWNAQNEVEKKPIILYRYADEAAGDNKEDLDIILNILKSSNAEVLSIEKGIQFLQQ